METKQISIEQRTLEWYRTRLGKITGSCVGDLIGSGRSKKDIFTAKGYTYLRKVVSECMLPEYITCDEFAFAEYLDEVNVTSKAMRIGTEREEDARELYRECSGIAVEEVGSIEHPEIKGFASSPDGVVREGDSVAGVVEIKCPRPETYIDYLANIRDAETLKEVNAIYYWQCMSHMAVTGAKWCDFITYCPYNRKPIHIVRIERDESAIETLLERVRFGLDYVGEFIASMER